MLNPNTDIMPNTNLTPVTRLTTNHKVQLETGEWVKIKSIENGLYRGSIILNYSNGLWSCLRKGDKVQAICE